VDLPCRLAVTRRLFAANEVAAQIRASTGGNTTVDVFIADKPKLSPRQQAPWQRPNAVGGPGDHYVFTSHRPLFVHCLTTPKSTINE